MCGVNICIDKNAHIELPKTGFILKKLPLRRILLIFVYSNHRYEASLWTCSSWI